MPWDALKAFLVIVAAATVAQVATHYIVKRIDPDANK